MELGVVLPYELVYGRLPLATPFMVCGSSCTYVCWVRDVTREEIAAGVKSPSSYCLGDAGEEIAAGVRPSSSYGLGGGAAEGTAAGVRAPSSCWLDDAGE